MAGFIFGDIACTDWFGAFGSGDLNGRIALTSNPVAFFGFGIERDKSSEISFHRLFFFDR